jgi:LysM repeat protein
MKTYRSPVLRNALAILIVMSLLIAALPKTAQAATCDSYYTVRSGDTKTSIAKRFGLDWGQIADANNMETTDRIRVGQRLCIPPEESDDDRPNPNVRLRVSATHLALTLTVSGLSDKKAVFFVRVRDARVGIGGWSKLGRLKVKKGSTTKEIFLIPKEFKSTLYLQVCIKNGSTDEMKCQTVVHP